MTKRRWAALAVSIVGLAVIGLAQGIPNRHSIEDNLTQRSNAALQQAGLSGVKVSFVGRDGTLLVPTKNDLEKAKAVVEGLEGVRVVSATAPEEPPKQPLPKATVRVNGTSVSRDGQAALLEAIVTALGSSADNVTIELSEGAITLTGKVESAAIKTAAETAAAQVAPGKVTSTLEVKPEVTQRRLSELPQITFEDDSATLTPQGQAAVAEAAAILKDNPTAKVRIEGHTDSNGTPQANQVLSEARAKTVLDALVALGIDPQRLTSAGFGESRPKVQENSAADRAVNRRVEFIVV